MKIKDGIIIQQMDKDFILIDSGVVKPSFSGMIRLNKTSKVMVEILQKEDLNKEQLIDRLFERYNASREVISEAVGEFINQMSKTTILII